MLINFTLAHGFVTVLELLVLSTLALIVFMGFGFFISSVAKNQNVIPIYANLFMFPQYFLCGTFFPKTVLPKSIHWLIEALPLTSLNDALRKVAFEGLHLNDCWKQVGILGAWGDCHLYLCHLGFQVGMIFNCSLNTLNAHADLPIYYNKSHRNIFYHYHYFSFYSLSCKDI